jgi:hypothetical protein
MKLKISIILYFTFCQAVFPQNEQFNELNIKAFLDDFVIEGPVYKNTYRPLVQGTDYFGSFVNLKNVFNLFDAEVKINDNEIFIKGGKVGNINISYKNQTEITINYIDKNLNLGPTFTNNAIVLINTDYYITISMVRYLINGALKQFDDRVILYTSDYERLDIPLTLDDCYKALDNLLDAEDITELKESPVDDLILYHMGLGMWIRNNWIRQSNNRIRKIFIENGIRHPDVMSQVIIIGYYYYLNGIEKSIMELINE